MSIVYRLGWWRVYGASPYRVPCFRTEAEALAYVNTNERKPA